MQHVIEWRCLPNVAGRRLTTGETELPLLQGLHVLMSGNLRRRPRRFTSPRFERAPEHGLDRAKNEIMNKSRIPETNLQLSRMRVDIHATWVQL